jgi:pyruvate dehydrogenase E2 component (dihydrolipoamide acetyltransferase)
MSAFFMPALGADMDWGIVVEWLKQPGDTLKRGDIIAVVETQKGAIEIEVFEDGVLDAIKVEPGRKVPVGEVLAMIRGPGENAAAHEVAPAVTEEPKPAAAAVPAAAPAAPVREGLRVTPAARREAEQRGIDLSTVAPGPDGVIGLKEIEAAAPAPPRATGPKGLDLEEMRKAIAAAMARSKREIPHYYVSRVIDAGPLMDWLGQENAKRTVEARLLYVVPLLKAAALALKKAPQLNGRFEDGVFRPSEAVHVGAATAIRGGGLIAPAIHEVDTLDLDLLMDKLRDLVARVRGGRLRSSEMMDPTVTLSNLGEDTADAMYPVIYPPQVAIIGCGAIVERPWIVDGVVVLRKLITVSVAGDHRVSDGRVAAQFLNRFDTLLQAPDKL